MHISGCPIARWVFGDTALDLDDTHANCEEKQGDPLERGQFAAEENDGERGSGQDFHLVGDLEGSSFQVRGSNKLKIILNDCLQKSVRAVASRWLGMTDHKV